MDFRIIELPKTEPIPVYSTTAQERDFCKHCAKPSDMLYKGWGICDPCWASIYCDPPQDDEPVQVPTNVKGFEIVKTFKF